MNIQMAINSQLSTIESKKQTKQTSRTETSHSITFTMRLSVPKTPRLRAASLYAPEGSESFKYLGLLTFKN